MNNVGGQLRHIIQEFSEHWMSQRQGGMTTQSQLVRFKRIQIEHLTTAVSHLQLVVDLKDKDAIIHALLEQATRLKQELDNLEAEGEG